MSISFKKQKIKHTLDFFYVCLRILNGQSTRYKHLGDTDSNTIGCEGNPSN